MFGVQWPPSVTFVFFWKAISVFCDTSAHCVTKETFPISQTGTQIELRTCDANYLVSAATGRRREIAPRVPPAKLPGRKLGAEKDDNCKRQSTDWLRTREMNGIGPPPDAPIKRRRLRHLSCWALLLSFIRKLFHALHATRPQISPL